MRRYAALSVNEVIVIEYGAERFYVRVVELKPGAVVSLCGDVDLEMDFSAPEVRRRRGKHRWRHGAEERANAD